MIIAPNGVSWQPTLHQPRYTSDEQTVAQIAPLRTPISTANTASQHQSGAAPLSKTQRMLVQKPLPSSR